MSADDVARLLAAWRASPSPALADRLEEASAEALDAFDAPKAPKVTVDKNDPPYKRTHALRDAFQAAWLEVAAKGDAVATGWLASTLVSRVPYTPWGVKSAFVERVEALRKRAPDPRVARALAEIVVKDAANGLGIPENLYEPVLALLATCRDSRQVPVLERALASPQTKTVHVREWLAKRLPKVIAKLREAGPVPEPAKPKREPAEGAALLAAIHEHPSDDATRLVYADWLEGQSDPRGELIALQVREARGEATPAQSKRARELLRAHEDAWLGDLRPIFVNVLFTRGFLSAASLSQSWAVKSDAWARLQVDPRLATLEELRPGKCSAEIYLGFLRSPACRSLARVAARDPKTLAAIAKLAKLDRRFTHLEMPLALFVARGAPYDGIASLGLTLQRADELTDNLAALKQRLPAKLTGLAVRIIDGGYAEIDDLLPAALTLLDERAWLIVDDANERYVMRNDPRAFEVWARRSVDDELLERIATTKKRLKVKRVRLVTSARVDDAKGVEVEKRLPREIAGVMGVYVPPHDRAAHPES